MVNGTHSQHPTNGMGNGGYAGGSDTIKRAVVAFTAIAWYNIIEILVLVFFVFKRYSGIYFWSLVITTIAMFPYSLGAYTKQLQLPLGGHPFVSIILQSCSWVVMITGQSIVLWSRLHLITRNRALLRFIIWMILVDTLVLCTPTLVFSFGANTSQAPKYVPMYAIIEKIQMTIFTVQECFISGVYLWQIRKLMKTLFDGGKRKLMWQLVAMNALLLIMDFTLVLMEYMNQYEIETTYKSMVYAVKLKIEFGVLSKIVNVLTNNSDEDKVARSGRRTLPSTGGDGDKKIPLGKIARTQDVIQTVDYYDNKDQTSTMEWGMASPSMQSPAMKPMYMGAVCETTKDLANSSESDSLESPGFHHVR